MLQNRDNLPEAKNKNDELEENNQSVKYKYQVKGPPPHRRQEGGKGQENGVRHSKNIVNSQVLTETRYVNKVMDFNGIQCLYTNADSLSNKLGELMTRIQDEKNSYEVIGITELYPKNCRYLPGKAELQLEGYELFLSESTSSSKRGAALYVNKKLKSEEIKFNVKFEESVWTQIKLNNKGMLLLGCIYKSPNKSPENLDELNKLLTTVSKEKKFSHIMVMGDFPKVNWKNQSTKGDKNSENFVESIRDSYLFQHVLENTRMRDSEPSTLDIILTNDENMSEELN